MADFEIGQIFLDKKATNHQGTKGKYYISLSDAEYDDDEIICFVFNTENHMYKYKYGCNKEDQKYILKSNSFTFLKKDSSIMLNEPVRYFLSEMYYDDIVIKDMADINLCRQIKNCIDLDYIIVRFKKIILESFKSLPKA